MYGSMFREETAMESIRRCVSRRSMATLPVSWPVPMRAIGAQNLLTMPGGVTASGYLHKKGGSQFSLKRWPLRFIIVHKGCVYYFKTSSSATPQGAFSLSGYNRVLRASEETTSTNVFPFKIVHFSKSHRTWLFSAASEDERRKWMQHLRIEIDHFNDKKELQFSSNDESDPESFYGPVEKQVEINPPDEDSEEDYMRQDEDSDEEDSFRLDESSTSAGRILVPPPPYPPPPVPHLPRLSKGPPPLLPPPFKKPTYSSKNRGPPPPLPHLEKTDYQPSVKGSSGLGPPVRPPSNKKPVSGPFSTMPVCEKKAKPLNWKASSTLPIVESLHEVNLNPTSKSLLTPNHFAHRPEQRPVSPQSPSRFHDKLPKPPLPTKPKPSRPSLQRASPDGQSFRLSFEEKNLHIQSPENKSEDSDEGDYENVQLPHSVFVDTAETCYVERMFKEMYCYPQNGLYCIRKSGTGKTSQVLVVWDRNIRKARNYRIFEEEQNVYLETDAVFPTLAALVEYYYIHPLPSNNNSQPCSLCLLLPYGYVPPR